MTKSSIVAETLMAHFKKKLGQNLKELSRTLIFKQVFEKQKLSAKFLHAFMNLGTKC